MANLPKGVRGFRRCLQLTVENLFSSFPQDAEISAFELRSILNKILAKRECLPPAAASHGHQQVSPVAMGAEGTTDLGRVRAWALPQTCCLVLHMATIMCSLCCFRGLQKRWGCASPEGVSQDVCFGRVQMGAFYPSICHWELAARRMDGFE